MQAEIDYIALGARIRTARDKAQITQAQLAEACDLSTSHIGHIERGSRVLSVDVLYKIAVTLRVSVDYLLLDTVPTDDNMFTSIYERSVGSAVARYILVRGDSGYQGILKLHKNSKTPKKKPKGGELTAEEKAENRRISRDRIGCVGADKLAAFCHGTFGVFRFLAAASQVVFVHHTLFA